jgi:hypothetical protein
MEHEVRAAHTIGMLECLHGHRVRGIHEVGDPGIGLRHDEGRLRHEVRINLDVLQLHRREERIIVLCQRIGRRAGRAAIGGIDIALRGTRGVALGAGAGIAAQCGRGRLQVTDDAISDGIAESNCPDAMSYAERRRGAGISAI